MVVLSVVVTALVTPLVNIAAKSSRRFVAYKRRTIRWWNPDSELRILVCVHSAREVPSLISLLDISHPTKRSPFFVYALYLVELTGRASTLFVINTTSSASSLGGPGPPLPPGSATDCASFLDYGVSYAREVLTKGHTLEPTASGRSCG
ncbi:Cation/H(+) antiporter 15 [Platanthera guangdongensis]|uniref:Cation/H(+) antiporter 15 n=1 Tax=Platanthera guangdongensis TaxID=2320717 RepID=A0ABR2M6J9_9ASPA